MTTININLLPEELRSRPSGGGAGDLPPKEALVPIGIGVGVALLVALVPYGLDTYWLQPRADAAQEQQDQIQHQIKKYNTDLKALKARADRRELLKAQYGVLQKVTKGDMAWAEMLNELRSLTPGNLWFESFKTDNAKGTLQIVGSALDYPSVAYFHRNLMHSDFFENPVLSRTEMTSGNGGTTVVKFTMDVAIRKKKS